MKTYETDTKTDVKTCLVPYIKRDLVPYIKRDLDLINMKTDTDTDTKTDMKTCLVPYIKKDSDLIKLDSQIHKPPVLNLIYTKISKNSNLSIISNEELFNAEMLNNTIRVNSIALNKGWFKSVNSVADVASIREDIKNKLTEMRSVSRDGFINDNDVLNNPLYSTIKDVVFNYRGGND